MEWLEKLLGKETADLIESKLGGKKLLLQEKDGDFIPKSRFDEVNTKKTELEKELNNQKESLTNTLKELETLKAEKTKGTQTEKEQLESLNKKISDLENSLKAKDESIVIDKKRLAVENKLRELGVTNPKHLKTLVREFESEHPLKDLEVPEAGLDNSLFESYQKDYSLLFGEVKPSGFPHNKGGNNGAGDFYTMEEIKSLTQAQVNDNLEKVNKSLANIRLQGN